MNAVLKFRKGLAALFAVGFMYYILIGQLPADVPADLFVKMYDIFAPAAAMVVCVYIGATAYESSFSNGSEHAPIAEVVQESKRVPFDDNTGKAPPNDGYHVTCGS